MDNKDQTRDERDYLFKEEELKAAIVDHMANPVVMFGRDDRVMMYNASAGELLGVSEGITMEEFAEDTNLKFILTRERCREGKNREFNLAMQKENRMYLVHGKELWSEEQVYQGLFLIYNDITDQENMKDEATYYATHDKLTGLWNRDYFFEMVDATLAANKGERFLLIASDIAQFKLFNDILGSKTGDELLLSIAEGFQKVCRENWVFARFSGDRFALLMPKKDYDEKRFLKYTHQVFARPQYSLNVHNYLGVYEITEPEIGAEQMYDRAFMALESVKGSTQKEIAYYDDHIRARRLAERLTFDELEQAMKEEQFVIYIQPQVNSQNQKVIGGEVLVRWISPKRGMVSPAEFIPIFEKNGMITKLDYYVWELACKTLARWKEEGHTDWSISVNISAKDFYLSNLYESITGLVEKYGISPHNLKLELTETAFVLDVKEQMALVKRLQERGFLVEMDDFGSGYSSLNSLKDIRVDVLKLDMKFFEHTDDPMRSQKIIQNIVQLADSLNMPVIAEGVEEEGQIVLLQLMGCHLIQGFFYSKPIPVEEFEQFVCERECEDIRSYIRS